MILLSNKIGFKYVFERNPDLRYIIFAGKGGLGKTTSSAGLSYKLSDLNKKVLCFSTDPQASLSDVFERDLFGKGEIEVKKNLYVLEIDADKRVNEYIESIRQKIRDMYKIEEIPREIEDYIESSKSEPAMYESAVYDAMIDVISQGRHDYYIFDMPPFGHGIRMIAMADILAKWVDKIYEARKEALELDVAAARLKGEKLLEYEDQIMKELNDIRNRIVYFSRLLTDERRTAFVMVLIPEKMAILDTERAVEMFEELGLKLRGIVINQIYPPKLLEDPGASDYLKKRVLSQKPYLREIYEKFSDLIIATIPMFNREPKGLEMISRIGDELWESSIDLGVIEEIIKR
ncbi:MAG: TRC40/GET3/ArsA family transport-energizing ATPase [Desulfurococcales archaeon]|nr:TRC40/GET3/ArsA family transport-energizing ATPase [Desulfurococcales archaeon]